MQHPPTTAPAETPDRPSLLDIATELSGVSDKALALRFAIQGEQLSRGTSDDAYASALVALATSLHDDIWEMLGRLDDARVEGKAACAI